MYIREERLEYWSTKPSLTQEGFENLKQLGMWQSNLELTLSVLFIAVSLYALGKNELERFIQINALYFLSITLVSYLLFFTIDIPIGYLLEPLIRPISYVYLIIMLYLIMKNLNRRSRSLEFLGEH